MPKLSNALAASALLVALAAPSFAADVNGSASTTIQNSDSANAGVNTRSGASTQLNDRNDVSGSTSLHSQSTLDRDMHRPQSAQMPNQDQDRDSQGMSGPGRSSTTPGHEMQENGSIPGSPGASNVAGDATDVFVSRGSGYSRTIGFRWLATSPKRLCRSNRGASADPKSPSRPGALANSS